MRLLVFLFALGLPSTTFAASWCANPLWVHEWGVQIFDAAGAPTSPVGLPGFFHRTPATHSGATPVRHLPPDSGIRLLPVLHFYSPRGQAEIPVGVEVGFSRGEAFVWFPQVDLLRSARAANSQSAARDRAALLLQRSQLNPLRAAVTPVTPMTLPSDPTRQLVWDQLVLTRAPRNTPARSREPWVTELRDLDALWVNRATESERFVFYEARTNERVPLSLDRGDAWRAGHRHIVLRNTGRFDVHDVYVTHREGESVYVFFAPSIPARRSTAFVLEEHRVARGQVPARTRRHLRARLVDSTQPAPPTDYRWDQNECTMMRDPAVPVETSEGHRLYAREVDAILDVWGRTFFDRRGTTITYREDTRYLDQTMPLSLYTDMSNFILLRRASLAVWRNVVLP